MVPEAGLEPARLSTVDFESTASTIPPLGQVHMGAFKRPCTMRQSPNTNSTRQTYRIDPYAPFYTRAQTIAGVV